jgi:hypothetical protein
MLDRFYRRQGGEKWPVEVDANGRQLWQRAIHVRRLAEDAALGPPTEAHPYSEAVWRVVQPIVHHADASRRRAEDLLFAPEKDRKPAFELLDVAEKQYRRAADRAVEVRTAIAVRDDAMADLPYLGRWSVFEGEQQFEPKPSNLWKAVHELAKQLDDLPSETPEAGTPAIVRHEGDHGRDINRPGTPCYVRDGGRPPGIGLQDRVPNHRRLHGSRARVVSASEKAGLSRSDVDREDERK